MKHVGVLTLSLAAFLALGCGAGGRQLQSITVAQTVSGGKVSFIATGHYTSAPATVTPLAVSWGIGLFAPPPGTVHYTLTAAPYVFTCPTAGSGPLQPVSVFAPRDPNAPSSGSAAWTSVVTAYAQIQCP